MLHQTLGTPSLGLRTPAPTSLEGGECNTLILTICLPFGYETSLTPVFFLSLVLLLLGDSFALPIKFSCFLGLHPGYFLNYIFLFR